MNLKTSFFDKRAKARISHDDLNAAENLAGELLAAIPTVTSRPIVFVCIGTDRSTGDSLGPIVGTLLEEKGLRTFYVYGTLDEPIHAVNLSENYIREIKELKQVVPFVTCGAEAERFGCTGIYTDDEKGVEELLIFLKNQGYHKISFIGGGDEFYPSYIKKKCAYKFGEKLGLDVKVRWLTSPQLVFSYEAGYEGMKMLLNEGSLPDVVCGINDYVALGIINAALEAGLKVPDDIAVTGFDDVSIDTMTPVHITTVSPRYEYFGKKVFNSLHKLIQNKDDNHSKTSLIKPDIIIRSSTR
jgi:DNA-binding LacI/PurR family transcriptional regulator